MTNRTSIKISLVAEIAKISEKEEQKVQITKYKVQSKMAI